MANFLLAVLALVTMALPVMAQDCELYIVAQQRCFPWAVLSGAIISASSRVGQSVFTDVTNIQGCRRIVLAGNDEYTIQISANGYSPETKKIKNLCLQMQPLLTFALFPVDIANCPPMILPVHQPGDPNS
jgi:hypothetical protein